LSAIVRISKEAVMSEAIASPAIGRIVSPDRQQMSPASENLGPVV
jgi:hypothetical protein